MLETVELLTADWQRLKAQKARITGGIEGRVLLNIGFVLGEQYVTHKDNQIVAEQQDANKLYLVFNLIAPRFNKLLGRLTSGTMNFTAVPNVNSAQAMSDKEIVIQLDRALDRKLNQPMKLWETLWWC